MSIIPHWWKSLPSLPENSSWSWANPPPTMANTSAHALVMAASTLNTPPSRSTTSIGRPPMPPRSLHQSANATEAS